MKKQILLTASIVLLTSCTLKDNLETQDETGIRISVADFGDPEGIFAQDNAKSIVYYDAKKFKFAWEKDDEIGVFPILYEEGAQSQQLMMTVTAEGGLSTTYSGSTVGWILNHEVEYASYSPMQENYDLQPDNIVLNYTGQTQTGNDTDASNMGHLGDYDYLYTVKVSPTADGTARFSFQHAGAIVRFRVPAGISGTFTAVNVTAQSGNSVFPTKMKLDLTQGTLAPVETSSTFTVNLAEFSSAGGDDYYLNVWCMMPPVDLSGETLTVSFVKGTAARDIKFEIAGKNLSAGSAYSFNGTDKNLPDFIDLGLSVLWATWNVGATSPEEVGNYYAWGELETKSTYNKDSYKFYTLGPPEGYTRYNDKDHTYLSLLPEDDVVTATYGSKYRIPSSAELAELTAFLKTCTSTEEGTGIRYSKDGKSIFFAKSGYINGTEIKNSDYVTIWANDRNTISATSNGNSFSINGTNISNTSRNRVFGQPVRAVKPKNN